MKTLKHVTPHFPISLVFSVIGYATALLIIMLLTSISVHAQGASHNSQNITGHGNAAVIGDSNQVNSNASISGGVNISTGNGNTTSNIQSGSYDSKSAAEDLATGKHGKVLFEDKKESLLPKSDKNRLLILTATNYETQVIQEAAAKGGLKIEKEIINDQVVYNLGTLGGVDIIQMQPAMMGMLEPGSTPLVLMSVFKDIKPDYIIATGIAFGRKSKGQELGDILVSKQLVNYESRKEANGDIYFRGDKVTSPMLGRINAAIHSWKGVPVHQGVVLSGNALVNSQEFLDYLSKKEPEYAGGDMESYGVYSVASMMKAQWVMIKGISDWGDGTKNDKSHHIALENVSNFIFYVIAQGNLK